MTGRGGHDFKYTQSVQQTGAGSKKTADVYADVVCRRETTVDVIAENCLFVNALNVRTQWCRLFCYYSESS